MQIGVMMYFHNGIRGLNFGYYSITKINENQRFLGFWNEASVCFDCGASSPYQYAAVTPPSIGRSLPVIKAPSEPISKAPTFPTSSGVPARPTAESSDHPAISIASGSGQLAYMASGAIMIPGLIVLIRAPRLPIARLLPSRAVSFLSDI